MGLIGIIIASLVNLFLRSSGLARSIHESTVVLNV
jgi:FtsH-binding integral membrane protein